MYHKKCIFEILIGKNYDKKQLKKLQITLNFTRNFKIE
jgi:hypothetical protein